ncbi:hypothetical protein E2C01_088137 [Portunus trituberculatus]|uniref:Uncharacterized protein n=1 Tax=Portunus trituberculatus TaxID=210409 RepID=A0A5B7J9Z1_PORTR|nr:hypothetical protein [Portunus trituberculatus]
MKLTLSCLGVSSPAFPTTKEDTNTTTTAAVKRFPAPLIPLGAGHHALGGTWEGSAGKRSPIWRVNVIYLTHLFLHRHLCLN